MKWVAWVYPLLHCTNPPVALTDSPTRQDNKQWRREKTNSSDWLLYKWVVTAVCLRTAAWIAVGGTTCGGVISAGEITANPLAPVLWMTGVGAPWTLSHAPVQTHTYQRTQSGWLRHLPLHGPRGGGGATNKGGGGDHHTNMAWFKTASVFIRRPKLAAIICGLCQSARMILCVCALYSELWLTWCKQAVCCI